MLQENFDQFYLFCKLQIFDFLLHLIFLSFMCLIDFASFVEFQFISSFWQIFPTKINCIRAT